MPGSKQEWHAPETLEGLAEKADRNLNLKHGFGTGGAMQQLKRLVGTVHLVIGAYILVGILLALYLNVNIFFMSLSGISPFVVFVAALLAVSDLAEGLAEYLPKK